MKNKDQIKAVIGVFTYSQLLINAIDDITVDLSDETKEIYNDLKKVQDLLIPYVDSFYKERIVSRDTTLLLLQEKIDYQFKKMIK